MLPAIPFLLAAATVGLIVAVVAYCVVDYVPHPALLIIGAFAALSEMDLSRLVGLSFNFGIEILIVLATAMAAIPGLLWLWVRRQYAITGAFVCFLLLPVIGLLSSPWSVIPFRSAQGSLSLIVLLLFVFPAADRFGFTSVAAAIAFGLMFVLALSLAWDLVGPGTPPDAVTGLVRTGIGGLPRWQGLTDQPNQLGRVAASCTVLCLLFADRWPKSWVVGGLALGIAGLAASQSKTSIVAALLVMLILAWKKGRIDLLALAAVVPVAAILLMSAVAVNPLASDNSGVDSEELLTATGRTTVWTTTFTLAAQKPLLGHGAYAAYGVLEPEMRLGRIGYDLVDPHNTVLNVLLTQGLIGVGLLLATAVLLYRSAGKASGPVTSATLVLSTLFILSLAENVIWKANSSAMLIALCLSAFIARELSDRAQPVAV